MIIHYLLAFAIIIALAAGLIFLPIIWWESHLPYSDEIKHKSEGDDD